MASMPARKGPQAAPSPSLQSSSPANKRSAKEARLSEPKPKRQRTKAGCITCRVRGKKCDEQKVDDGESCETCKRLRLHCLGFQDRRPDWLRSKDNIKVWRKRVTEFLLSQGLVKGHAGCGLRPGNAADASLTLDDMRRDLDAPHRLGGDDGDSGPEQGYDPEAPRPIPFAAMFEQPHPLTLPPLHNVPPEPENPQYIPNIPKRFENAIGGIGVTDDNRHRWVPPPPFGPPLKKYEDDPEKYGPPPANNKGFAFQTPFNPAFNPKYYREQPRPMHNPSGSASSVGDMKPDPSYGTPNTIASGSSGQMQSQATTPASYNGVHNNNSDARGSNSAMYNPSLSPSSVSHAPSSFAPAKPMAPGYNQTTPTSGPPPGYAQTPEAGQSSGPERFPLRQSHSMPQVHQEPYSQPQQMMRHEGQQFHPYRRPTVPLYPRDDGSNVRQDPLSIKTSSIRPSASISPTQQLNNRSVDSASTSSPDTYENTGYGSYNTPSTATPYGYANVNMSIQSLLHASSAGTPGHGPPSSAMSTMAPTPTTAYANDNDGRGENGTTTVMTTYFQGYPAAYAEYAGPGSSANDTYYTPMIIQPQAAPAMSLSDFYIQRYFTNVIGVQYRLANHQMLPRAMYELSERSLAVKTSISLLSVLYFEAQQLAQAGIGGNVFGADTLAGQGMVLGDSVYSQSYQALDLGVPGLGFINSSSLIPSNTTNSRAQFDLLYARVKKLLEESKVNKGERYDEGDAMACLHVISAFLFSGGRGNWDEFLQIAASWVWSRVYDYGGNVRQALAAMDSMGRFIFRTTMWMDVFGSISLCQTPRFLSLYRTLFTPGALDTMASISGTIETNMDRVMGCPNEVVLAFAEIAHLEARKADLVKRYNRGLPIGVPGAVDANGYPINWNLNGPEARELWRQEILSLEAEGVQIERYIPEAYGPAALPMDRFVEIQPGQENNLRDHNNSNQVLGVFGSPSDPFAWLGAADSTGVEGSGPQDDTPLGGYVDPDEDKRGKISEVFRNAARVYLHSVVSGCDPLVPKIRRAVQATIRALETLGASPLDRSLIFPLTITGCLAATRQEVQFCIRRLSDVGKDAESLGNCLAARQLIGRVWDKRIEGGYSSIDGAALPGGSGSNVSWRSVMLEMNRNPLLLV